MIFLAGLLVSTFLSKVGLALSQNMSRFDEILYEFKSPTQPRKVIEVWERGYLLQVSGGF